jgi:hypothetical protein
MENPNAPLFLIAGSGDYPRLVIEGARKVGVTRIAMAVFEGETDPTLAAMVDVTFPMRVGQLGKLLEAARESGATRALMAGQITPSHLFNLRPDFKALVLLAKLKERNAESLFGAVGAEMTKVGVNLISATTFLDDHLATLGLIAGPRLKPRHIEDLDYGFRIAKETSRLDIGQTRDRGKGGAGHAAAAEVGFFRQPVLRNGHGLGAWRNKPRRGQRGQRIGGHIFKFGGNGAAQSGQLRQPFGVLVGALDVVVADAPGRAVGIWVQHRRLITHGLGGMHKHAA